jgi:hypothetical protein
VAEGRERGEPTIRRAAPLNKKGVNEGNACPRPTAKKSAALRSAWKETLSRPSATLPRKRGREGIHRMGEISSEELVIAKAAPTSSLRGAQRRGNPVHSIRRAAPLIIILLPGFFHLAGFLLLFFDRTLFLENHHDHDYS